MPIKVTTTNTLFRIEDGNTIGADVRVGRNGELTIGRPYVPGKQQAHVGTYSHGEILCSTAQKVKEQAEFHLAVLDFISMLPKEAYNPDKLNSPQL